MVTKKYPTFIYSTLGEKRLSEIWDHYIEDMRRRNSELTFSSVVCKLLSKEFGVPYVVTGGSPEQPMIIYRVNIT